MWILLEQIEDMCNVLNMIMVVVQELVQCLHETLLQPNRLLLVILVNEHGK